LTKLKITNSKGRVLADRADIADTIAKRNTGLLKHLKLEPGEGLLIPTQAVHTFRMNFPIDVLFLSRKRKVLKIRANMVRGRIAMKLSAHSVLELPAGMCAETETVVGDLLMVDKYEG
jgi:uncharacterized membrane protein (UPF0127 family)